ncbi:hypothetical protein ACJMK2_016188 [Sinanodonta woodiana]|uniref:Uncharacterized protein n=1 Tax=Sinanodonta woodiana TaxID=1069815 RepID=A0ABD3UTT7_SINWO
MTILEKMAMKFKSASIYIIIVIAFLIYSSKPSEPVNIPLIAGAVIGSLVGVALLISGICLIINCSKSHTRRSPMIAPQVVTTNTQQMPMQPMQPMYYQPFYQAPVTAYPAYPVPSGLPMPPPYIYPSTAEPLPLPIYFE